VHEGTGTVDSTDDVGHARLVSAEGGEVGSIAAEWSNCCFYCIALYLSKYSSAVDDFDSFGIP
jgi:hypothetical protein